MTPEEFAKTETKKEFDRRLINFTTAMVELVYWDRKPLEQALASTVSMQRENSRLRDRIAELEGKKDSLVCINPESENSKESWWVWICSCDVMNHKSEDKCARCGRPRPTS